MNPSYVLPIFLGVLLTGLCIWNVVQTGKIEDLEEDRDEWRTSYRTLADDYAELTVDKERLLNNLTVAVSQIPKRDMSGKFRKK